MRVSRWWLPIVALQFGGASLAIGQPLDCSAAKLEELLSPATAEAPAVQIDCHVGCCGPT